MDDVDVKPHQRTAGGGGAPATGRDSWASPVPILRLEGLALLAGAVALYAVAGGRWWVFALLLFLPDLSMLGYLRGPRPGAAIYNLAHTTVLPILLGVLGHLAGYGSLVQVALIWLAHVGLDRALGYGLKAATGFGDTHLGPIGRRRTTGSATRAGTRHRARRTTDTGREEP